MRLRISRPVIVNAEPIGYSLEAREILASFSDLRDATLSRANLLKALADAHGLIVRLGYRVDEDLFQAAPKLRFVATATTGLNHIDLNAAAERNIVVLSLKGETSFLDSVTSTAEHTWGLLLALVRHLPAATEHVRNGGWDRALFKGRELSGMTLGVIGYGRLGRMVVNYGKSFGMRVLASDPNPISRDEGLSFVSMSELLENSDVISLHVALNTNTYRLLDETAFNTIKAGAYLVNTSRGELLDEQALLVALASERLAGAALDVLANEIATGKELFATHPLREYARNNDNLLITPHIGGATYDAFEKTEIYIAQRIKDFWRLNEY